MQYFTSRGCPHSCSFCCLSSKWQPKDIQDLDRELSIIYHDIGFDEISFSDPNIAFGASENERIERISQIGKIMRKLNVRWDGNLRSPYLSPRMVDALVESNCYSIEIGCESGNDYFLRKIIRKGHGVNAIKKAALTAKMSGISIMYSFIAHMPRETRDMMMDTFDLIDWIVNHDPDARVSIFTYAPFPGTKMYKDAVEGAEGYPRFAPPETMKQWAELPLMKSPTLLDCRFEFQKR